MVAHITLLPNYVIYNCCYLDIHVYILFLLAIVGIRQSDYLNLIQS